MSRSCRHSPGISEGSEKWDKRQMNHIIRSSMREQLKRCEQKRMSYHNVEVMNRNTAYNLWLMRKDGHNVSFGSFRIIVKVKRERIIRFDLCTGKITVARRTYAIQLPVCSYWCASDNHRALWHKSKARWCVTNIGFGK